MIEVGEYVRTEQGYIARLESIYHDMYSFDNSVQCSYGEEMPIIFEKDLDLITKHSFNIIDLIELGDYVNGNKILKIFEISKVREGKELFCMGEGGFEGEISYFNEDIQTVVTKEQFKSMEYKVGGEDD